MGYRWVVGPSAKCATFLKNPISTIRTEQKAVTVLLFCSGRQQCKTAPLLLSSPCPASVGSHPLALVTALPSPPYLQPCLMAHLPHGRWVLFLWASALPGMCQLLPQWAGDHPTSVSPWLYEPLWASNILSCRAWCRVRARVTMLIGHFTDR